MSKAQLYQKIVKVMEEVGQLQKDGNVTDMNGRKMYAYLSEEQTTGELQKAFVKFGLVLFPIKVEPELIYLETVKNDKVVRAPITKVVVTYKICDSETGEYEELQSIGYGSDSQDKGSNKAMTGAFKYVQRQTFMISTGDDGDHEASEVLDAQYERPRQPQSRPNPQQSRNTPPPSDDDLAAIQQESARNTRQTSGKGDAMKRVFDLRAEMNLGWKELNELASAALNREVKYPLKDNVKTAEEWERIESFLRQYRNVS